MWSVLVFALLLGSLVNSTSTYDAINSSGLMSTLEHGTWNTLEYDSSNISESRPANVSSVENVGFTLVSNNDSTYEGNYEDAESNSSGILEIRDGSSDVDPDWVEVMSLLKLGTKSFIESLNLTDVITVSNVSDACRVSLERFLVSLSEWETWAVMMADASGKIPGGILDGTTMGFGSFDECIKIRVKAADDVEDFRGRYCMVGYQSPLLTRIYEKGAYVTRNEKYEETYGHPPEWIDDFIKKSGPYLKGIVFLLGTCVPSTCSEDDVRRMASHVTKPLGLKVSIPGCQVNEPRMWTSTDIIAVCFLGLLAILCTIGTAIDIIGRYIWEDQSSLKSKCYLLYLFRIFSLYLNTEKCFQSKKNSGCLDCLNGLRFISSAAIVITHTCGVFGYFALATYRNFLGMDNDAKDYNANAIFEGGYVAVDTFFFMSGLLTVYTTWKKLETSGGRLNILRFMFHKYWRLTPSLALTISIFFVISRNGSGPLWNIAVIKQSYEVCQSVGWRNFLYINNWFSSLCLSHTWFLSALMQLHLVGVILLCLTYRWPIAGIVLSSAIAIGSSVLLALVTIWNHYLMPAYFALKVREYQDDFLYSVHIKTYTHVNSYLVGMAAGFIILKYNKRKLTTVTVATGWLLAVGLAVYVIYGKFFALTNRVHVVLYHAIHRTAWSLSLTWTTYACVIGYGGVINRFLSWTGFQLLGNISFLVYLLHYVFITYRKSTVRERIYYGEMELIFECILNTTVACLVSVVAYIAVELPFATIGGMLVKK